MVKKILIAAVLLFLAAAGFWWSRDYVRLSFDQVSPFRAVSSSNGVVIGLPNLGTSDVELNDRHLWHLDARRVVALLDTLGLQADVEWADWWLLPEIGDGPQDAVYTFIGSANSGLAKAWNPREYGPTLGFGEGEIYTFGIATDDPVYYARYHNLFLAGRYPFQLENALLTLLNEQASWEKMESFQQLEKNLKERPTAGERLILRTAALEDNVPVDWIRTDALRKYREIADWLSLEFVANDSVARISGSLVHQAGAWSAYPQTPDWDKVPEIAERVFPLSSSKAVNDDPLTVWRSTGGWQMELTGSRSLDRPAPELWVLPIGDTTAFAKFKSNTLSPSQYLEERAYQLFDLIQLRTPGELGVLSDRRVWQPWVVELPDAVIVSVYREDIERYLDYFMLGASLNKQSAFLQLATDLPTHPGEVAGYYRWGALGDRETNWLHLLFPQYEWSRNGSLYYTAKPVDEKMWQLQGVVRETPEKEQASALRWTSTLPVQDSVRLLPVQSDNEALPHYFMTQTANGDCRLLNDAGEELWLFQGAPKIFPPIWRVDLSDGQVNYVATSEERLHIWNQDGVPVFREYTAPLPSAGVTVVSFDRLSPPHYLFPTTDGTVEMRDWKGSSAEGWPSKLSGRVVVTQPLVHWQLPDEDYLIAWAGEESWQMFGRFGNFLSSLPPVSELPLGRPAMEFDAVVPQASRLLMATATGKVNVWDLDGSIFPLPLGRGPVDNFLFSNIWGDGRGDYIAQRGNLVHLFGYDEENTFKERWQQRLSFVPVALLPAEPLGVIAVQRDPDQLWLIDGQGAMLPGFPLGGDGQAILSGDSAMGYFLVTTLRGEVYAYEIKD